jgi:hypothetical protein
VTTFHVTSEFPAGTTGSVTFRRKEWLTDAGGVLIPPADVVATLAGSPPAIDQVLRASQETGVSPDFSYDVLINLDGHAEMKGILFLTANADLGTAIQFTSPANPDLFVTKAEFEELVVATGDPASQADLLALEAVVDTDIDNLDAEISRAEGAESTLTSALAAEVTRAEAAESAEVTRAEAAEDALDTRVTTLEGAGGGGGSGSGALATVVHYPVIQNVTASTSSADVDATHLKVTFDAPASGNVIIQLQAVASIATNTAFAWGVSDHGSFSDECQVGYVTGDGIQYSVTRPCYISGLTPGNTYTFFWRHRCTFGIGSDVTVWGGETGPAVIQVYEAP